MWTYTSARSQRAPPAPSPSTWYRTSAFRARRDGPRREGTAGGSRVRALSGRRGEKALAACLGKLARCDDHRSGARRPRVRVALRLFGLPAESADGTAVGCREERAARAIALAQGGRTNRRCV